MATNFTDSYRLESDETSVAKVEEYPPAKQPEGVARRGALPRKTQKSTEDQEDQTIPEAKPEPHRIRGRLYDFSPT